MYVRPAETEKFLDIVVYSWLFRMVLKPGTRSPPRREPRESLHPGERWYKASLDGNSMALMLRIQERVKDMRAAMTFIEAATPQPDSALQAELESKPAMEGFLTHDGALRY